MGTEVLEGQQSTIDAAEETAMESAFNKALEAKPEQTKTTADAEVKQSEPETTQVPDVAPVSEPDPWGDFPPKAREMLEATVAAQQKLEHRLSSNEGRVGKLNELYAAAQAAAEQAKQNPTEANLANAEAKLEKWDEQKEDLPELAEAIEQKFRSELNAERQAILDSVRQEIQNSTPDYQNIMKQATSEARQLARIDLVHEDWETVVNSEEFSAWSKQQPPDIQALASSDKASDAIRMIGMFKEQAKKQQANKTRLESAVVPQGVPQSPGRQPLTEDEAMSRAFHA